MQDEARITIRIPGRLKNWLDQVREEEGCSLNYQIIRALQDRMQAAGGKFGDHTPAAN